MGSGKVFTLRWDQLSQNSENVKLHSNLEIQLNFRWFESGVGVDFVFALEESTYPHQPVQHILINMEPTPSF